ncbi:MAG: DoxX family protein [Acidimicrobiales bacterium]|nr:DoxX family protein [Acidimicrobiales bacterium]
MFTATVIVTSGLALVALGSAIGKLTRQPMVVDMLTGLGVPTTWLPRLAAAELAGGVGLVVGLAVAWIGIAAAAGLTLYFVGAAATHIRAHDSAIAPPALLAVVAIAALVLRIASA